MACEYQNRSGERLFIEDTDSFSEAELYEAIEEFSEVKIIRSEFLEHTPGLLNSVKEVHTSQGRFTLKQSVEGFDFECSVEAYSDNRELMKTLLRALESSCKFVEAA